MSSNDQVCQRGTASKQVSRVEGFQMESRPVNMPHKTVGLYAMYVVAGTRYRYANTRAGSSVDVEMTRVATFQLI